MAPSKNLQNHSENYAANTRIICVPLRPPENNGIVQRKRPSIVSLRIAGLLVGTHEFSYTLEPSFFESRELILVNDGRYTVDLKLHKHDVSMSLEVAFEGSILVECDLCSEFERLTTSGQEILVLKPADDMVNDDDSIIQFDAAAPEIILDDLLYDLIILSVPLRLLPCADADNDPTCGRVAYVEPIDDDKPTDDTTPSIWDDIKNQLND